MPGPILILVLLGALASFALVWYQYLKGSKRNSSLNRILAALRFISILGLIVLLVNPKFTRTTYDLEPAVLNVLIDNSSSMQIAMDSSALLDIRDRLASADRLQDRFQINQLTFGTALRSQDTLLFDDEATNISEPLERLKDMYIGSRMATVLLTDGNQTLGDDYEFMNHKPDQPVFPIVVGDTTTYEDLRIDRVNMNQYAYLKNQFPLEIFTSYSGEGSVNTVLEVSIDGQTRLRRNLTFSGNSPAARIAANLEATRTGLQDVRIQLQPFPGERNTLNNTRRLGLEVIDEKTRIMIVSNWVHPDLGALKKSIEQNEQREVFIERPTASTETWKEVDLFILYQPNSAFREVYDLIKREGISSFTITGPQTDWDFVNQVQNAFSISTYGQSEEIFPFKNEAFTFFDVSGFDITDYPPLDFELGEILFKKEYESLLDQQVKGVVLGEPMLTLVRDEARNEAFLFGENIWKWRVQNYRNNGDFEAFDDLIAQIIRFLDLNKRTNRLTLDYDKTYQGVASAELVARYFNETLAFESNASLNIRIKEKSEADYRAFPMMLRNGYYGFRINDLSAGEYDFTVRVEGTDLVRNGNFRVLDFDVEKQLISSNYKKLNRLAQASGGQLFYGDQVAAVVDELMERNQFLPVQKSKQNVVSLIDFRVLLGIIALSLAAEWFIRKYNGLI